MSEIYVQGIAGHHNSRDVYTTRAQKLREAGFVCLHSRPEGTEPLWEVWMLQNPIQAKGPLKGQSQEEIVAWCTELGVGRITYGGTILSYVYA